MPPNGAFGWIAPCLLIQTEPPSPFGLSLAAATASSTSEQRITGSAGPNREHWSKFRSCVVIGKSLEDRKSVV